MKSWDAYQGTWGEEEEIRYDEDEHIDEEEDIVFPANNENKCSETINSQTSTPVPIRSGSDAGSVMFERGECTIEFPQSPIAMNPGIIRSRANQCISPASASGDMHQNNSKSQSSECLDQASARDSYLASICRCGHYIVNTVCACTVYSEYCTLYIIDCRSYSDLRGAE